MRELLNLSEIADAYHESEKKKKTVKNDEMLVRQMDDCCAVCNGDDYSYENLRLQCAECEIYVHLDCVGEKAINLRHEMSTDGQLEVVWRC